MDVDFDPDDYLDLADFARDRAKYEGRPRQAPSQVPGQPEKGRVTSEWVKHLHEYHINAMGEFNIDSHWLYVQPTTYIDFDYDWAVLLRVLWQIPDATDSDRATVVQYLNVYQESKHGSANLHVEWQDDPRLFFDQTHQYARRAQERFTKWLYDLIDADAATWPFSPHNLNTERKDRVKARTMGLDLPYLANFDVPCKFCRLPLHLTLDGFWVDDTDGDGCMGDDSLHNENHSHVPDN